MKNTVNRAAFRRTFLLAAMSLLSLVLSLSAAQAAGKQFKFSIGPNQTLVINSPDGTQLATLPTATVGKTIDFGAYSFQVSYGQDANGNLSLIVTANPDHPTNVDFSLDGRSITMDQTSAVTLTLTNNGNNVIVDPGYTGTVKVNGQAVTTPVVTNVSATGGTTVTPITGGGAGTGVTTTTTTTTTSSQSPSTATTAETDVNPTTTASNSGTPSAQQTQQQQQQPTGTGTGLTMDDPLSGNSNIATSDVRTNPSAVVNPITSADPTTPS